jgi:uncharacterized iron-regulated membrane protein
VRYLYLTHRWLGLTLGPLIVLWLLSGVVMLFVSYPSLTHEEQIDHLQPLQRALVKVLPETAWQSTFAKSAETNHPKNTQLAMQQSRPVYYFLNDHWQAVWADSGTAVVVNRELAIRNALAFQPAARVNKVSLIALDQWSFSGKLNPHRPLYKVSLDNENKSEIYISSRTGQVVLETSQHERFWNWLGSITHWVYFTELRAQREVWRQVILWPAGAAITLSALGIWIGIVRMRLNSRYSRNRHTPYRGFMRIHHIAGYTLGLILFTWLFSGWLSMTPMNWLSDRSLSDEELNHWQGKSVSLHDYRLPDHLPSETKILEWIPFSGQVGVIGHSLRKSQRLHPETGEGLPAYTLPQLQSAAGGMQAAPLPSITWLTEQGDAYYNKSDEHIPVARVSFDGDACISYYINAITGEIVSSQDTRSRAYRWLFTALHTWNFPGIEPQFWRRFLIILLSVAGLIISLTGLYYGFKRLARQR